MITRRNLMKGVGAGLISSHLPSALAAQEGPSNIDVLVIGAGLSGLYAASMLEEFGATVQVVEGRSRIGGRLFTNFDLPGHPEVGGNTIGSGYARVLSTAKQLGVKLIDYAPRLYAGPPPEVVLNGTLVPASQWAESILNPLADGQRKTLPWQIVARYLKDSNPLSTAADWLDPKFADLDISLHAFFSGLGMSDDEIRIGYDTNPYFGTSASDVSALVYLFNDRWIKEQGNFGRAAYAVEGGNQRLPEAMATTLKREVLLNKDVAAIDTASAATVHFKDGSRMRAKRVICSVPFSKLRDIAITPTFEPAQRTAVSSLQYMRNSLLFLVPRKAFWEQDGLSPTMWTDGIAGTIMAQKFGSDPNEVTGLVTSARGWNADRIDRLGPADAGAAVIREIERLRPAAKGQLEFGGYHSWWLDPFAAGDWAVPSPGQVRSMLPTMSKPHQRIHFCGEHTATTQRGMEGAMESAERAVIELAGFL